MKTPVPTAAIKLRKVRKSLGMMLPGQYYPKCWGGVIIAATFLLISTVDGLGLTYSPGDDLQVWAQQVIFFKSWIMM
jgi:hypothetical protein